MYIYLFSLLLPVTANSSCNRLSELQKLQQTTQLISDQAVKQYTDNKKLKKENTAIILKLN